MKRYRIMNRITKEWWEGDADSAQEACQKAGWLIANSWVRERTPTRNDPSTESGHAGGGWKTLYRLKPSPITLPQQTKEVHNHEL